MARTTNRWMGRGRFGQDPEMKYTPSGSAVLSFSIACSEGVKNATTGEWEEKTEWINLVAWNKDAEIINLNFTKGDEMMVLDGILKTRSWENKEGIKQYRTEVTVRDFVKCERLVYPESEGSGKAATKPTAKPASRPQGGQPAQNDDDLPF